MSSGDTHPGRDRSVAGQLEEEEAALRRLILSGDDRAQVALVVVHRAVPRLMAFLRQRFAGLAEEDAYDVAAEALSVAIERRATFDVGRGAKVRTWLYGIAAIKAADFLRRRGDQVRLREEWEDDAAGQRDVYSARLRAAEVQRATTRAYPAPREDAPMLRLIRDAILALPEQQRKAAVARYLEGLPPEEIDRLYGWKPNTAHVYLSHARKAIRRRLASAEPDGHTLPTDEPQPRSPKAAAASGARPARSGAGSARRDSGHGRAAGDRAVAGTTITKLESGRR